MLTDVGAEGWALGRHMPEARRGAARQSSRSVLCSSPAWSPEQMQG